MAARNHRLHLTLGTSGARTNGALWHSYRQQMGQAGYPVHLPARRSGTRCSAHQRFPGRIVIFLRLNIRHDHIRVLAP
eukprot:scaffold435016_cov53-Prasinocladus_malaysianus.AAC.1